MRMKQLLLLFILFANVGSFAQYKTSPQAISADLVKKHALSFDLNDKTSAGYQMLESIVAEYDYVVIGEYHFSENIQKLSTEICDLGSKYGYGEFICESGRYSTQFLNEIVRKNDHIEEALTSYFKDKKFELSFGDESETFNPIAFLTTKQEVPLLEKLKEKNYHVYGIDQEFQFSTKMFVAELMKLKPLSEADEKEIYHHLDSLEQRTGESGFNYSKNLLSDSLVVNYLSSCKEVNWQKKFETWKESMEIYFGRRRDWRRINLMRRNFIEQVSPRLEENPNLKLIMKLGAFHTPKGIADLALYDMGDLISETAKQFHKKAVHIRCRSRYFVEDGELYDSYKENSKKNFFSQLGEKDKWVIVDLRSLRDAFQRNEFSIPESLVNNDVKSTIENNDILIISPADRELIEL